MNEQEWVRDLPLAGGDLKSRNKHTVFSSIAIRFAGIFKATFNRKVESKGLSPNDKNAGYIFAKLSLHESSRKRWKRRSGRSSRISFGVFKKVLLDQGDMTDDFNLIGSLLQTPRKNLCDHAKLTFRTSRNSKGSNTIDRKGRMKKDSIRKRCFASCSRENQANNQVG